eukprot:symbB.v1.2.016525.t1/scaffold1257.1/size128495/4
MGASFQARSLATASGNEWPWTTSMPPRCARRMTRVPSGVPTGSLPAKPIGKGCPMVPTQSKKTSSLRATHPSERHLETPGNSGNLQQLSNGSDTDSANAEHSDLAC